MNMVAMDTQLFPPTSCDLIGNNGVVMRVEVNERHFKFPFCVFSKTNVI